MASTLHSNNSSSSSSLRFWGLIKQPDSSESDSSNPLELDEGDVVWSSSPESDDVDSISSSPPAVIVTPFNLSRGTHVEVQLYCHLSNQKTSGLSAALSDDHRLTLHRKSYLNSSLSAATAAKVISRMPLVGSDGHGNAIFHQSAPMNVPVWPRKTERFNYLECSEEIEDELAEEEMVPPHEIVARSHVAFSVFEGVGRTLKGRDLRRVRNAVLRSTGLIE